MMMLVQAKAKVGVMQVEAQVIVRVMVQGSPVMRLMCSLHGRDREWLRRLLHNRHF